MAVLFRFNLFQTFVGGIIGVLLGLIAGFMGGIVDSIIMRIMDGFLSFPPPKHVFPGRGFFIHA